jgi:peptidoglycan/LPS O-acetylase OafA/YrhL
MGQVVNLGSLLLGVMAFALWTYSRLREAQGRGLANALGGIGILALIFSTVTPDDDLFQKELIRPATQSVNVAGCLRAAPRRQLVAFQTMHLLLP